MSIRIEHPPGQLLQKKVAEGCPPAVKGTYIERIIVPTHKGLLEFLEERLVGKEFKDEEELRKVLETWPEFAKEKGLTLSKVWEDLWITDHNTIAFAEGPDGDFDLATIHSKDD